MGCLQRPRDKKKEMTMAGGLQPLQTGNQHALEDERTPFVLHKVRMRRRTLAAEYSFSRKSSGAMCVLEPTRLLHLSMLLRYAHSPKSAIWSAETGTKKEFVL